MSAARGTRGLQVPGPSLALRLDEPVRVRVVAAAALAAYGQLVTEHFAVRAESGNGPWRVLAGGDRTGGQAIFGEALLPARTGGPSLHVHTREDEAAYVIEGALTVRIGDRTMEAGAGTLVWLPRHEPHTFANLSDDPVRVFGVTTPAGLEGMFLEQAEYFAGLAGPPDEGVVAEIGRRYGVQVVGPGLL